MMSFDQGIHALPNAIAQKLGDSIILNTQVDGLTFSPEFGYQVRSGDQIWQAQEVILAVPSAQVARIIDDLAWPNDDLMDKAVKALRDIEYPAVASITMAFYKDQIQHPLDGFGCLLPSKERQKTLGVLFPSSIFANRCPNDQHLMTVFIGGARGADVMNMTPEQRVQIILKELSAYLGIVGQPLWYEESLWPKAIPQYNLGHLARIEQVENALSQFPGLHLRSNWRDGVAVGDCVEQAFALANKLNPADTPSAI
jgi:oxygen-dependent protoporphyrinogen oxidase